MMMHSQQTGLSQVINRPALQAPAVALPTATDGMRLKGRSIVSIHDLSRAEIELVLNQAACYQRVLEGGERPNVLTGKVLATLFFEPSTRTRLSFESAMYRLSGAVISTPDGHHSSSAVKGESIADTIRTVTGYCDVIVQRHPAIGSAQEALRYARPAGVPVINAGDGAGEHPSQALLDLYTIRKERGAIDGLNVVMVGDLKHGRTVHSLLKGLCHWNVTVRLVSPDCLRLPVELIAELRATGAQIVETNDLESAANGADLLYMTRIQKERFATAEEYEALKGSFVVDGAFMRRHDSLTLMHPLPRVDEIAPEVDEFENAAYFRQTQNGLYVRMAILALVLGKAL
ncbi:MAG TPA: aspartate carbamoyltransferase [Aggregatilineales bacterium]|nr:aspartate carbamoyltransferase [Aggregatilineales bacterium]